MSLCARFEDRVLFARADYLQPCIVGDHVQQRFAVWRVQFLQALEQLALVADRLHEAQPSVWTLTVSARRKVEPRLAQRAVDEGALRQVSIGP